MARKKTFSGFAGRILIVGFGCIGRAVLPLLLRHTGLGPDRIRIVGAGRLLLRNIAMCFDAYLDSMMKTKPVFSRTV